MVSIKNSTVSRIYTDEAGKNNNLRDVFTSQNKMNVTNNKVKNLFINYRYLISQLLTCIGEIETNEKIHNLKGKNKSPPIYMVYKK